MYQNEGDQKRFNYEYVESGDLERATHPVSIQHIYHGPTNIQEPLLNVGYVEKGAQPKSIMVENCESFNLGRRDAIRILITRPGDQERGILDYGTLTGEFGIQYEGYLAAIKTESDTIPSIVLEIGVLTLPSGKTFTGDFHVAFPEKTQLSYLPIPVDATIPFSPLPHYFFGSISGSPPQWAVEKGL